MVAKPHNRCEHEKLFYYYFILGDIRTPFPKVSLYIAPYALKNEIR